MEDILGLTQMLQGVLQTKENVYMEKNIEYYFSDIQQS
jgi:hypothetical protein